MLKIISDSQRLIFSFALDLLAEKVAEDEAGMGKEFPYVTGPDGHWKTLPASLSTGYSGENWDHGNWFCGFWVGLQLASYLWTGDERHLNWARARMEQVRTRADDGNTHDIGFIFESSAIPAFRITGDPDYASIAM